MRQTWSMKRLQIVICALCLVSLAACSPAAPSAPTSTPKPAFTNTSVPTSTPIPNTPTPEPTSTSTPVPTPTIPFEVPTPKTDSSTLIGLVLWNKQPAEKVAVELCKDFDYQGCHGTKYSGTTNKDGYYLFSNIKPGEYVIVLHISSDTVLYRTDGINPIKDSAVAGQVAIAETRYIFKDNLKAAAPAMDAEVSAQPTLKWDPYPGAAYYQVTISALGSDLSIGPVKVKTNEYTVDQSLVDCTYQWGVEAYNDEDQKIGETPNDAFASNMSLSFHAVNPDSSCRLTLLSPKDNAEIQGNQGVEFSWEPNPQATCYRISLGSSEGTYVLGDFGKPLKLDSTQTSYKVDSVPKGVYTWGVEACNASDQRIASSYYITLIVR